MKLTKCLELGLGIAMLACAAESGSPDEVADPAAGEVAKESNAPLPVVLRSSDGSALVVGSAALGAIRLSPDFSRLLAGKSQRWIVHSDARQRPLDVASPEIALDRPLVAGDVIEIATEDGDATSLELQVAEAPPDGVSSPPTQLLSTSGIPSCWFQCNGTSDANTFAASTCGACGVEKRKYEYRVRSCTTCGLMCSNGSYYGQILNCGPWQAWFSWCDYC
jgi:hypothetical protein